MATEKEVEAVETVVEQPPPVTETEEAKPEETDKPVKEKKTRAPKEKKPKQPKTAAHPPYFEMIKEALLALNEKNGSSPYAIAKYMEEKHKSELPANFKKILALQLKNSATRGKLMKIKASYKLSEATPKVVSKRTEKKKAKAATAAPTRKTRSVNKTMNESAKKPTKRVVGGTKKTKKSTPAKPKQPKSIKSPAKRTKKAAVATATS